MCSQNYCCVTDKLAGKRKHNLAVLVWNHNLAVTVILCFTLQLHIFNKVVFNFVIGRGKYMAYLALLDLDELFGKKEMAESDFLIFFGFLEEFWGDIFSKQVHDASSIFGALKEFCENAKTLCRSRDNNTELTPFFTTYFIAVFLVFRFGNQLPTLRLAYYKIQLKRLRAFVLNHHQKKFVQFLQRI